MHAPRSSLELRGAPRRAARARAEKPKKKRGFFRRNRAIVQSVLDTTAAYTKVVVPKTADENAFIFKCARPRPAPPPAAAAPQSAGAITGRPAAAVPAL